ncbi:bifunctional DNA primase/polymerase [Actinacidiphila bryophytorum]|uniref:Bifunctional DNA primase/polymerase, N-terminal n=1 Tax=Actinacidiphila bryophytorum TaxID=1436133 RepID=A0A9W4H0H7_9ACTN|nr:bifunctional DNA primase/polymerase [Actinacidiphila bryophytorum]MBM9438734.1 bifunctional DNA primase/polymerase [Actinacidiphila bryophytorum]MBN6546020.1 bifunctional DNA primase/polymerase [Actinacidiphila bryophytorum]CAG7637688.1 Bifunctional DNA primase/polymerase, N-terminal [Actinacidiphila bryophytorum]
MTQRPRTVLLAAALTAAERGWPVVPLHPRSKIPALHGDRRCPRTGDCTHGHRTFEQRATTDPERIRRCWSAGAFNVGIATGPAGLVVVDLDTLKPKDKKGTPTGAESFLALCERAGQPVPTTYRTRTPSGGEHLYFAAPAGARLPSSSGSLAPKIDTRAWGGQVVAPGSVTRDGTYAVLDTSSVAALPPWLQAALTAPEKPATGPYRPMPVRDATRCAAVALEREAADVAARTEVGCRNKELLRAVIRMGRFVAWGDIDRTTVEAAFQAGGESAGLTAAECRTTIQSGLAYSLRTVRPRETR